MRAEVHLNRVLYKIPPFAMKALYRQIAVVEQEQFQVRIFEGQVVQTNPKFIAERSNAEVRIHPTLKEALDDAESEFKQSIASEKWEPYDPSVTAVLIVHHPKTASLPQTIAPQSACR